MKGFYLSAFIALFFYGLTAQPYDNKFYLTHTSKNESKEIKIKYAKDSLFIKDDLMDLSLLLFDTNSTKTDYFVIAICGDGGWMDFTNDFAKLCKHRGIPVVGFSTLPYFMETRKPEKIAIDLQRVIVNFSHIFNKNKVMIMGYSFGAEILPYAYNNMNPYFKQKIISMGLVAPSTKACFKVSPTYIYTSNELVPLLPALLKNESSKIVIFCDDTGKSICKILPENSQYKLVNLDAGHNFIGRWASVAKLVADNMGIE